MLINTAYIRYWVSVHVYDDIPSCLYTSPNDVYYAFVYNNDRWSYEVECACFSVVVVVRIIIIIIVLTSVGRSIFSDCQKDRRLITTVRNKKPDIVSSSTSFSSLSEFIFLFRFSCANRLASSFYAVLVRNALPRV